MLRAARQAAVDLFGEKSLPAGKPSFGLDEVEEEHPSELQQHVAVPVGDWEPAGKLCGHPLDGGPKLPKESAACRLGRECVGDFRGIGEDATLGPMPASLPSEASASADGQSSLKASTGAPSNATESASRLVATSSAMTPAGRPRAANRRASSRQRAPAGHSRAPARESFPPGPPRLVLALPRGRRGREPDRTEAGDPSREQARGDREASD